MRTVSKFHILVFHIGENLVQVIRVKRMDIILCLHRVRVVLCVDNQHPVTLREHDITLHADRNPILTRSEVYSGVYGRASITFYAFNSSGNRGIACGLNNLQKIRDGEPLGGKASAESDFATDEDDDFLD